MIMIVLICVLFVDVSWLLWWLVILLFYCKRDWILLGLKMTEECCLKYKFFNTHNFISFFFTYFMKYEFGWWLSIGVFIDYCWVQTRYSGLNSTIIIKTPIESHQPNSYFMKYVKKKEMKLCVLKNLYFKQHSQSS